MNSLSGLRVTIMGLGLHGGGVESAKFCASQGADVLVTDLRDENILAPSLEKLSQYNITYVLGRHREEDFLHTDLVIKNPGVKRTNPYLQLAPRIATDLSLFFAHYHGPILGITGTKGKSSTASALAYGLQHEYPRTKLGGNITISPLSFLSEIQSSQAIPVVLELSSFQLGDLHYSGTQLPLTFSGITNIESDHQDYYGSMETYVKDKETIFLQQQPGSWTCFNGDQPTWTSAFLKKIPPGVQPWCIFSKKPEKSNFNRLDIEMPEELGLGWIQDSIGYIKMPGNSLDDYQEILPAQLKVPGEHQRMNLLQGAIGMVKMNMDPGNILNILSNFPGIPHRIEYLGKINGTDYYNDSAATIPEAVLRGVQSFTGRNIHLISGGTDKGLDFLPFREMIAHVASVHLLDGSATQGILSALEVGRKDEKKETLIFGPYKTLREVVLSVKKRAQPQDVVLFSPGCASFGLFLNEFDRGNQYKALIESIQEEEE